MNTPIGHKNAFNVCETRLLRLSLHPSGVGGPGMANSQWLLVRETRIRSRTIRQVQGTKVLSVQLEVNNCFDIPVLPKLNKR